MRAEQLAQFAQCRSMGHEWKHHSAVGSDDSLEHFRAPFGGSTGMVGMPSTCNQCGTERMRWLTRSGESLMRYHHPDGYSQHGDEKLSPLQWRRTFVAHIFDEFESKQLAPPPPTSKRRKRAA